MRKVLLIATAVGVLFACAGLVGLVQARTFADWSGARWLLIIAWLILMPLFGYLVRLRGTARQASRRRALERKRALDAQAAVLRTPEGIRAAGGSENPPPPGPS